MTKPSSTWPRWTWRWRRLNILRKPETAMPTTKVTKLFKEVLQLCRRNKRFLISAHQNPDADAAASALAMAVFLKSLGKQVVVVNDDPLPEWLAYLPLAKSFKRSKDVKHFEYDVAIILDCGG